jgi:predicted O-linked N-acetylglucosamine transferase (SPINDLY family)
MKSKFDEALTLFQNGQLNKAKDTCLEILKAQPNNFNALHLLGLIAFQTKNYLKSVEIIDRAIQVKPNDADIYNFHAVVLIHLKKFEEAIKSWNCAIKIKPDYAEAYYNRGNAFFELKKIESAIANYDKAIQIKPDYAEAYNNHGNALRELKKIESAKESYDKAIQIKPDYAEAYYNRGNTFIELKKIESAIANYDKTIQIKPNYAEAYNNRGTTLLDLNKIDGAFQDYNKAIQIKPNLDYLFGQLFFVRNNLCDWSFFNENLKKLKDKILKFKKASTPFSILSIYDLPSLQKIAAETYLKAKYSTIDILEPIIQRESNKKIRIGYYSADFREHAVSYVLVKLFELHDKSKFELIGFSFGPDDHNDEMRKRVSSAFDQFINVNFKNDKEIALLSRDFKIDIAVDLMGFTKNNRFGIFVERCAPIQVNYLGYSATTGADCIDYIIGDKVLIPKENQKDYSEKIIYLPDCFMGNDFTKKISDKIFTREELGLPKEGFVFCCFNKNYKITPNVFDCWMKILKKVKGSVLWLFENNPITIKNLQQEANKRDIGSDRLIFAKPMALDKHLARHKVADLFVDTFPYTAHTTCSDALWAGLPVLTCAGESFASRVSASLLNAIGLSELATHTIKGYEDMAIELANNPIRLKKIKNELKKNKLEKPLFNTKLFTKNIESAYVKIYDRYLQNLPADNIEIE